MRAWLARVTGSTCFELTPASSDASFRRYWRLSEGGETCILMDAPPAQEDCGRYADLARRFRAIGINTPEILAEDRAQGFMLISDLGDRVYLDHLSDASADGLYGDALGALLRIQADGPTQGLPAYDAPFLKRELGLFRTWFLDQHLRLRLSPAEEAMLDALDGVLIESALEQPQVCVHRDYHSRNLMITEIGSPGVLDFQDAVVGPVTYDLVSLLRDCYIAWPAEKVVGWALGYRQMAYRSGFIPDVAPERFLRWLDLMGLQRHLKVCGIFARLHIRDGKSHYLADLPRTLGYVTHVAGRHPELKGLARLLSDRVLPAMAASSPS
ncbi:phosphotransferase [Thiorhodococcus minor]|uniref:Phosphotransferase n=2 Tax=Thiorhodococcus minor TaxID=57489 RepID=A0A6M0K0D0_9GAMM|nr:phosphotransferase [Thiorhodococcus minor]